MQFGAILSNVVSVHIVITFIMEHWICFTELCAKKEKENDALQKQLEATCKNAETNLTSVKNGFSTSLMQLENEKLKLL